MTIGADFAERLHRALIFPAAPVVMPDPARPATAFR